MPAELVEISKTRNLPKSSVPLVLIHDGGGTIYQYHLLGPLNRDVYGIANPYFDSGIKAAGGIPELAMDYAEAIRRSVGSGPVIIGGELCIAIS
jgi:thioesterase domain-containing protein